MPHSKNLIINHCTVSGITLNRCYVPLNFKTMIEFNKAKDRFTSKSFSFEIDHKLDELEMESEEYSNNGLSTERHTFRISKDEAKKLVEYLSEWVSD